MGARHSTDYCAYDTLFTKSVVHIHEKIFFSLDYESFKNCLEVSKTWNELLTSESFQNKAKCIFHEEILMDAIYLFEATMQGNNYQIRRTLANGMVNIDLEYGLNRTTLLMTAANGGQEDIVQLLLNRGANPDKTDACGITPLSRASSKGHHSVVKLLLDSGANPNKAANNGNTPLYYASWRGHKKVAQLLMAHGANPNKAGEGGLTPLHMAAVYGHREVVKSLLSAGANPNKMDFDGSTPLHKAAVWSHQAVYKVLLAGGGDPHRVDRFGRMPPSYAGPQGFSQFNCCVIV